MKISTIKAVEKYQEVIESSDFIKYEKDFSQKIINALSQGYSNSNDEPDLVLLIEKIINNVHDFKITNNTEQFEISTKSIFLHGYRSQVKFKHYNQDVYRELCDIIFLVSVVYCGKKYFEKVTLNQFKKDKKTSNKISWSLKNKEQLYLLSRFPSFSGKKGSFIPQTQFNLTNYSGNLGSYGLLFRPGDFAYVSAPLLELFIGNKKTLKKTDLFQLVNYQIMKKSFWLTNYGHFVSFGILDNCYFASDVFDFIKKFLRSNIGEPIFNAVDNDGNSQVQKFLNTLIANLNNLGKNEQNIDLINFVSEFNRFPYLAKLSVDSQKDELFNNDNAGGLAIIHTTIDLKE